MKKNLLFILMMFVSGSLYAHPHLFIEVALEIHADEQGLSGIRQTWIFDEMFSAN